MHRFLCTLPLFGCLVAAAAAEPVERRAVLPLTAVEPGQKGYGLTVFEGREPQRFEAEILGVWQGVRPHTSYVLARLYGHGLETSGVIAGMSGSPVFVGENLLGAVAFAWPFSQQAIAGITPIAAMRRIIDLERSPAARSFAPTVDLSAIVAGGSRPEALTEALERLRPVRLVDGTAPLQWVGSGFGSEVRGFLEESLGGLVAGGRSLDAGAELEPGAAVAAVLVDGDMRLAASGTVTDRIDETILAFGHPFLGLGSLEVPMATADVVTVVSSLASSFKVTNLGPVVGAFDFDHATGIRGRLGREAPTVPLQIRLQGEGERVVELRLARLESVTPVLSAVALLGAFDYATEAVGNESLDLVVDIDLRAAGRLQIGQSFDGLDARTQAARYLFAIVGYLMQNDLAAVDLDSIHVDVVRHSAPRTLRLVGAHAARSVVRPGAKVALNFDLVAYRGGAVRKSLELELPTSLPEGRYALLVGDGVSIDVARLAIERVQPVNFGQALEFLASLHSRREIVVLGVFAEPGLAVAGEVLPRLPASVRSLWGAAPSGSAQPLRLATAQRQRLLLPDPVEGIVRVDLEVERPHRKVPSRQVGDGAEQETQEDGAAEPPIAAQATDE